MGSFTRGLLAFVLLTFTLPGISHAQATNLAGKWRIAWIPVGKPNTINLTEIPGSGTMTNLGGTYLPDSGEHCALIGTKSNGTDRQMYVEISCATWSISMIGTVAVDGQQINGGYFVHYHTGPSSGEYVMDSGKFVMDKIVCVLPEGCGN